ncbi:MAG: DUF4128 domain-containing protein [Deltaproteobacteria bacterium]|jgi:hypothetical protein|nr:DUF4128 domain-containing protein [Deltaproteobacteria bacterium]
MPPVALARIPFILDGHLAAGMPGLSIAFEGEDFTPPGGLWLRPVCQPGQMQDDEKGSQGWSRRVGLYLVDIIAPGGVPAADAWAVAGRVEGLFRRESILDVQIDEPYTANLGVGSNNSFQLRVIVPWWCWSI